MKPIFEKSCIRCHGGANGIEGELDQRTYAGLMKGGESGAVVIPGNSAGSLLYELIDAGKMPRRSTKLPQEQIDLIARWIDEGAGQLIAPRRRLAAEHAEGTEMASASLRLCGCTLDLIGDKRPGAGAMI